VSEPSQAGATTGPIALDALAYGIDLLDAILVFHLGDASVHAVWVRPDGGVRAEDVVTVLRDLYRVGQFASKRLLGITSPRAEAPAPQLTLELPQRTALLRRVRAHVIAYVFDAAMPLGMARMIASRLTAEMEPELPLGSPAATAHAHAPEAADHPRAVRDDPPRPAPVVVPAPPAVASPPVARPEDAHERAPHTLSFGSGLPRRSLPPPPPAELDRVSRLLAYLEEHAPEPHIVRLRLALRAGLTLAALERPDALGPEAIVLIEAAVQDILGIDRAELRRIA
jgi:hypothetical protein